MTDIAQREHPRFRGNAEDLKQFVALAATPIRDPRREAALEIWEAYKRGRQLGAYQRGKRSVLHKGDHIRALNAQVIDLRGANLDGICLGYADLRGVIFDDCSLRGTWMKGARLKNASFAGADLTPDGARNARFIQADLCGASFEGANLSGADFSYAAMHDTTLVEANLTDAVLEHATLVRSTVTGAHLVRTRVYGTAIWDVSGEPAEQHDLLVTQTGTPPLHVDDLKVAQFVYLVLNNRELRTVIDTLTTRSVLILGRFSADRKLVLDAVRAALRARGLVPIMFDFEPSPNRDLAETVRLLASIARFVIADISDAKAIVDELHLIIPSFPSVPIQPVLVQTGEIYTMFQQWTRFPWVLPLLRYADATELCAILDEKILPHVTTWEAADRARRAMT